MKNLMKSAGAIAGLAMLAGCVEEAGQPVQSQPSVGSATDVTSFVGAPAGQAEGGLRALGYEAIRSEGLTTYWFNRDTGACARITTDQGVYSNVVMVPAEDC